MNGLAVALVRGPKTTYKRPFLPYTLNSSKPASHILIYHIMSNSTRSTTTQSHAPGSQESTHSAPLAPGNHTHTQPDYDYTRVYRNRLLPSLIWTIWFALCIATNWFVMHLVPPNTHGLLGLVHGLCLLAMIPLAFWPISLLHHLEKYVASQ